LNGVNNPDTLFDYSLQNLSIKQKNTFFDEFISKTIKKTLIDNIYIINIINGLGWGVDDLYNFFHLKFPRFYLGIYTYEQV